MAYHEVQLHLHPTICCKECYGLHPHTHCYRQQCNKILFSGEKIARFGEDKMVIGRNGIAKVFCIPCGTLLSDSTVRVAA